LDTAASGDTGDPVADLVESLMQLVRIAKSRDFFSGSGLTRLQVGLLRRLHQHSPRRLTSLADLMGGDLSVISRQVNTLYEGGMVDRMRDPEDGRAWLITLTPSGAEALAEIWNRRRMWFTQVLADHDPQELEQVTAILRTIGVAWERELRRPMNIPVTATPP
jgi:DNA-binding MarR family transcriptional regulator